MNTKPSSSTSKNFIQKNIEKLRDIQQKTRTKSQELPQLSKPAKPKLQTNSKNPGGPSKQTPANPPVEVPKSSESQPPTPQKVIEVMDLTSKMIEQCVQALTPIKLNTPAKPKTPENAKAQEKQIPSSEEEYSHTAVYGNESEAAEFEEMFGEDPEYLYEKDVFDADDVFETGHSVLDTVPEDETKESEKSSVTHSNLKKTPESRYKESDMHQIIGSASSSDYVSRSVEKEFVVTVEKESVNADEFSEVQEKSEDLIEIVDPPIQSSRKKSFVEAGSQVSGRYTTRKSSGKKIAKKKLSASPEESLRIESPSESEKEEPQPAKQNPEIILRRSKRLANQRELKHDTQEKESLKRKKSKKNAGHKKKIKY